MSAVDHLHGAAERPRWVSVGGGCQVAHQLRRGGLRHDAMPLDWLRTPVPSVHRLFDTEFRDFLMRENVGLRTGPPRLLVDEEYALVLPHDLDAFDVGGHEALRRRYVPRVERLLDALRQDSHIVLVRRRISDNDAIRLAHIVQERRPQSRTTVLAVNDAAGTASVTLRALRIRGQVVVVSTPAMGDTWKGSDLIWAEVLGRAGAVLTGCDDAHAVGALAERLAETLLGADWKAVENAVHAVLTGRPTLWVPDVAVSALVAAEDHRFASHRGLDHIALVRAVFGQLSGRSRGGGSTIEQQLFRTLSDRRGRTLRRKLREMIGACLLARKFTKHEIAVVYLLVAYFGADMNGLAQACTRLRIDLSTMNEQEAAGVAARLKYPEPRTADQARAAKIERRTAYVLRRMRV